MIHWRHIQEKKVAGAAGVELVYEARELGEDCSKQSCVLRGIAVADVVYADENREQSII